LPPVGLEAVGECTNAGAMIFAWGYNNWPVVLRGPVQVSIV
jgi:hypothetical protein